MFFRQKKSGERVYMQIVANQWEGGKSKQRVTATLGRLDQLHKTVNSKASCSLEPVLPKP